MSGSQIYQTTSMTGLGLHNIRLASELRGDDDVIGEQASVEILLAYISRTPDTTKTVGKVSIGKSFWRDV